MFRSKEMTTARIKVYPTNTLKNSETVECWDNIRITVQDTDQMIPIIHINDRGDALDAYSQIILAFAAGHEGDLDVTFGNQTYTFSRDVWEAVGAVLESYVDEYMYEFHSDDTVVSDSPPKPTLHLV